MGFRDLLASEFAPYRNLSPIQLDALERHFDLFQKWNQRMNLTTITDLAEAVRFHYCESLFLGHVLPSGSLRIVDIGSGAGFPGFPIAVLRPECEVHLVESNHRRAVFLREICALVPTTRVVAKRAQDVDGQYDWAISRAVRPKEVLSLKLAPKIAILMSCEQKGIASSDTRPLPWGSGRVISTFHVKLRDDVVPLGT